MDNHPRLICNCLLRSFLWSKLRQDFASHLCAISGLQGQYHYRVYTRAKEEQKLRSLCSGLDEYTRVVRGFMLRHLGGLSIHLRAGGVLA